jgi:uncharacterized protein (DUF1697 family)
MKTFISMLRGVNVSGQKTIRMAELKSLYEAEGFEQVGTYVQSGNVVFKTAQSDAAVLAALIQAQIERSFGFSVFVFVRDLEDFRRILRSNPFLTGRNEDPTKLHVTFLHHSPSPARWKDLKPPPGETDEFFPGEKELFLFCPNGYGRTKLSNAFFEKKLGMPATTRNWNTVNALFKMATER